MFIIIRVCADKDKQIVFVILMINPVSIEDIFFLDCVNTIGSTVYMVSVKIQELCFAL